jgi:hypothetical protein
MFKKLLIDSTGRFSLISMVMFLSVEIFAEAGLLFGVWLLSGFQTLISYKFGYFDFICIQVLLVKFKEIIDLFKY